MVSPHLDLGTLYDLDITLWTSVFLQFKEES